MRTKNLPAGVLGLLVCCALPVAAADMAARDVVHSLFKAKAGRPIDFSGRDLSSLDLAGLDFKGARLAGANLMGADLSDAVLKGSDLSGARLDRATLARADFTGANLEKATILRPNIFSTFTVGEGDWKQTPRFTGARMAGARLFGRFDYVDFKGANLKGTIFASRDPRDESTALARIGLFSADFDNADLEGADFTDSRLSFASFTGAKVRSARFLGADLARANFAGADITGADFTDANLDEANFTGAIGFEAAKGMDKARNAERLIRQAAGP